MRKVLVALSLAGLIFASANAEVYAKVDGEEITDKDLMFLRQAMPKIRRLTKQSSANCSHARQKRTN